ncbi:MAG: hypothetical protein ACM3JI_01995 [Anaerolineae bacterium]
MSLNPDVIFKFISKGNAVSPTDAKANRLVKFNKTFYEIEIILVHQEKDQKFSINYGLDSFKHRGVQAQVIHQAIKKHLKALEEVFCFQPHLKLELLSERAVSFNRCRKRWNDDLDQEDSHETLKEVKAIIQAIRQGAPQDFSPPPSLEEQECEHILQAYPTKQFDLPQLIKRESTILNNLQNNTPVQTDQKPQLWHNKPITTFARHKNFMISGSAQEKKVYVWPIDNLEKGIVKTLEIGVNNPSSKLLVDGDILFCGFQSGMVYIYDLRSLGASQPKKLRHSTKAIQNIAKCGNYLFVREKASFTSYLLKDGTYEKQHTWKATPSSNETLAQSDLAVNDQSIFALTPEGQMWVWTTDCLQNATQQDPIKISLGKSFLKDSESPCSLLCHKGEIFIGGTLGTILVGHFDERANQFKIFKRLSTQESNLQSLMADGNRLIAVFPHGFQVWDLKQGHNVPIAKISKEDAYLLRSLFAFDGKIMVSWENSTSGSVENSILDYAPALTFKEPNPAPSSVPTTSSPSPARENKAELALENKLALVSQSLHSQQLSNHYLKNILGIADNQAFRAFFELDPSFVSAYGIATVQDLALIDMDQTQFIAINELWQALQEALSKAASQQSNSTSSNPLTALNAHLKLNSNKIIALETAINSLTKQVKIAYKKSENRNLIDTPKLFDLERNLGNFLKELESKKPKTRAEEQTFNPDLFIPPVLQFFESFIEAEQERQKLLLKMYLTQSRIPEVWKTLFNDDSIFTLSDFCSSKKYNNVYLLTDWLKSLVSSEENNSYYEV